MIRYAITSRAFFPGNGYEQVTALLGQAGRWAGEGMDLIQLREKDLPAAELVELGRKIVEAIVCRQAATRLLVNSRPDVAIASGAHGVHLIASAGELTPAQVRSLFAAANLPSPVLSLSCHTLAEVIEARSHHVDSILFAPVFEKPIPGHFPLPGQGLDRLREACEAAAPVPVYALGGVTLENASLCLEAGAAGVAGIRLFHG